jgi:hypothetical protein
METHETTFAPRCSRCDRLSAVILDGLYLCSQHGLIVVLARLEASGTIARAS